MPGVGLPLTPSLEDVPGLAPLVPIAQRFPDHSQHLGGENVLQSRIAQLKSKVPLERQLDTVSALGVVLPTALDLRPIQDYEAQRFFARRAPLRVNLRLTLLVVGSKGADARAELEMDIILGRPGPLGAGPGRGKPGKRRQQAGCEQRACGAACRPRP